MAYTVDLIGGENHGKRVRVDHPHDLHRMPIYPEQMYAPPGDANQCQEAVFRTELYKITPFVDGHMTCYVGTPINDNRTALEILLSMAMRAL